MLDKACPQTLVILDAHAHARIAQRWRKRRAAERAALQVYAEHGKAQRKLLDLPCVHKRPDPGDLRQPAVPQNHHRPAHETRAACEGFGKCVPHDKLAGVQKPAVGPSVTGTDARTGRHKHGHTVRKPLDVQIAGNGKPAHPHAHLLRTDAKHVGSEKERLRQGLGIDARAGQARYDDTRTPARPKPNGTCEIRGTRGVELRQVVDKNERAVGGRHGHALGTRVQKPAPLPRHPVQIQPHDP